MMDIDLVNNLHIRESETDNAKSVTKAEWEYHIVPFYCRCSSCGTFVRVDRYEVFLNGKGKLNFCPNCGTDMRARKDV